MNLMSKKAPAKTPSPGSPPDEVVIQLARVALSEVTGADTFQDTPVVTPEGESTRVAFPSLQPGYPGWQWTVSVSQVEGIEPTVLEVGLLPGEGSLVAPDWVPWADRLEEYLLHEKEIKDDDVDEDDDDELDLDDDVDGVDIDQLDLDLDPAPLEVPDEPDDVFDHVELDEPDPRDP